MKSIIQKRTLTAAVLAAIVLSLLPARTQAITGGVLDTNNVFPNVCMFLAEREDGSFGFCSGTLIHPRVVLTAGHCTSGLLELVTNVNRLFVTFEHTNAFVNGRLAVQAVKTHTSYDPDSIKNDVGLVILREPVLGITPARIPQRTGLLPYLDEQLQLGNLRSQSSRAELWLAGYGTGVEIAPYAQTGYEGARRYGLSQFKTLIPGFLFITQHEAPGIVLAGTCFGDSGGPSFYQDPDTGEIIQLTVTSWTGNCLGFGALQRLDPFHILDFIHNVLADVDTGKY